MATSSPLLLDTLNELLKEEFKNFKWHLKHDVVEGFNPIPQGKLENAKQTDVVDLMVSQYGQSGAGEITITVLKKIPREDLAEKLKTKLEEESCAALASASNPSSPLKELNLNLNEPGDSGVKQHSALLENPHCTLEEPQQEHCRIIPEGRAGLSSALRSNPSSYPRELNLNYNEPGDSGVKPISDLLEDPHCKLEKLEIIAKGHPSLSLALRSNPSSLLREKNLNFSEPGDSGVKQLSDLLEDHHRELEKRHQEHRRMIAEGRAEMRSNFSSHLREMNNSFPGISGFSDLLEDPHCTMEKLRQEHRRMIAEGRAEMRSNFSSHLREMNNSFPGISGLKHFSDLLEDPHCTMEKLHQEHRRMIAEGRAEMSMWTPHTLSGHGTPEPVITNRPITSRFMPRNLHTPPEFDTHTPNHFTHSYTSERVYRNVKWPPS